MTIHTVIALPKALAISAGLVAGAARCWRVARDRGEPVQRCLYALLNPLDYGMLSPVFDSLMTLSEAALGRKIVVGAAARLSDDEHLLVGLLDGSRQRRGCIDCAPGRASALDCAICSTRIMLALAAGAAPEPRAPAVRWDGPAPSRTAA